MDTVNWANSSNVDANDVMLSDNLLDFVKDEDIVNSLTAQDDILPQDIFNELINKFDFDDTEVNINSFLNDLNATDNIDHCISMNFKQNNIDDPLLSSTNTNINYSEFTQAAVQQPKLPPTPINMDVDSVSKSIQPTQVTHITSTEIPEPVETIVYQIGNNSIETTPFVTTTTTASGSQVLTPIQMVFSTNNTPTFQTIQNYTEITDAKPIIVQNGNKMVDNNGKSIIINPTVMYTSPTTVSSNSLQSVQLIDTANGTILAAHVPVSTIMVEQEQEKVPKVKEVKKSTHNAIERRYRTSINDKIVELKNMLVGEAGKLNKSAILKKSIDKISDLEMENHDLRLENARLREMLTNQNMIREESSLKALLLEKTLKRPNRYTQSSTPPTSDESNPSLSPTRSDTGSLSPLAGDEMSTEFSYYDNAKRSRTSPESISTHGMSTMSKLTLCAFMVAVITINPLGSLISNSSEQNAREMLGNVGPSRRTILGVDIDSLNIFQLLWSQFSSSLFILIANFIIMTVCLVKLCYHSDPVMNFRSPTADQYFKQKKIADAEFERGNAVAAFAAYEKCLLLFGVTLPRTWFELIPMTIWQFLRCCVHRLRFGQWLSRKFSRIVCSDEKQIDAINSAQELAIILNRCNQIHLSQNMRDGSGLILTMYAVNMAETVTNHSPLTLMDVYLTAALRCRKNYVYFFSWICSRYYFCKAKQEASLLCIDKLPLKYAWLFNNLYGYKFICKFSFDDVNTNASGTLFYSDVNPLDTLSMVFRSYNDHLLKCALQCLIGMNCSANKGIISFIGSETTVINDVLSYVRLLKENCEDPLTLWWANLFSTDASLLLGDDKSADETFDQIRKIPSDLRDTKDPLARAAVTVSCAKKLLAMKPVGSTSKMWSLCNCGGRMLEESLNFNRTAANNDMILFVQLLMCDWLLETRTSCWEINQNITVGIDDSKNNNVIVCDPIPSQQLMQFQNDLNSLHRVIDQVPMAKSRIYLYEAITRLMAGASPGFTQELLDRSFHEQYRRTARATFHCGSSNNNNNNSTNNNNNETNNNQNCRRCSPNINMDGERERAAAMYVACKYLPTPLLGLPGERAGLLAEAAKTLKKIGNQKKLNDCYQLMKSYGTTSVSTNCN